MKKQRVRNSLHTMPLSWPVRGDLIILVVSVLMGAAAANVTIKVPNTPTVIELRRLFGFMGFVLIKRFSPAVIIPVILSLAHISQLPWYIVLGGNLLYGLPFCLSLRFVYRRCLVNLENLFFFGVCWFALIMAGYQVFTTPLVHLVLGLLEHELSLSFILGAWTEQLWVEESIAVSVISAMGMVITRMYFLLRYREQHLRTILHSIGEGVIVTNCEEVVELMNPVAETLTGWGAKRQGESPCLRSSISSMRNRANHVEAPFSRS